MDDAERIRLRTLMGHFATGVTVVAARHGPLLAGMTANAIATISIDPPILMASIARKAETHVAIVGSHAFAASVLADDQQDLAECFAQKHDGGEAHRLLRRRMARGRDWLADPGGRAGLLRLPAHRPSRRRRPHHLPRRDRGRRLPRGCRPAAVVRAPATTASPSHADTMSDRSTADAERRQLAGARRRSPRIWRAARRPGAPITQPPGWVPEPHW